MLAERIDVLVPQLLTGAVQEGHEWRVGSCAGETGRSMAIHRSGHKRGVWQDFSSTDIHGDALDLVAQCLFMGDKKKAVAWARSWLGIDTLDPMRLQQERQRLDQQARESEQKALEQAQKRMKAAQAIWHNANPKLIGTPVDLYLLGRGIGIADLPRLPGAFRFASNLDYPAALNDGIRTSWPAMVAAITNHEGRHIATHRTFLQDRGGGLVTKAPVRDAKLTLGSYRGGYISVSRGASGKSLKDAPQGDRLIIAEGPEDALTLSLSCPDHRVLAAISVNNIGNIILPRTITEITIAADNDGEGSKANQTLQQAIDRFIDQGRDVYVTRSPVGKDFNDMLQAEMGRQMKKDVP